MSNLGTRAQDVFKYCPKCASDKFDFDGVKAFKCQVCGFHFFPNSAGAVAAIIVNESGELLLTQRAFEPFKGMLDLPGGFVDPNERAENAVIREIKEELNLDVVSIQFLASFPNAYTYSGYTVSTCDLGFVCTIDNFDEITVNDDVSDYRFVSPDKIDFDEICSESMKEIIRFYLNSL